MMQLQDPKRTKVLLVTLAETTPVLEAANLQADLRRAGIEPWAWVINNSVAAARPRSPLLAQARPQRAGGSGKGRDGPCPPLRRRAASSGRAGRRRTPSQTGRARHRTRLNIQGRVAIMSEATTLTRPPQASKAPAMGVFERYLTLWVALCIVAGVVLGQTDACRLPRHWRARRSPRSICRSPCWSG